MRNKPIDEYYAIVINLSGKIEQQIRKCWSILNTQSNINYISSRSPHPHITLFAELTLNNVSTQNLLINYLSIWVKNIAQFKIYTNGLGVFIRETPVIYLRWIINSNLVQLKDQIATGIGNLLKQNILESHKELKDPDWLAKTTICYNDTKLEALTETIELLSSIPMNESMNVKNISLYKYSFAEGEEQIATIDIFK